jgi:hypothetical protein
MAQIMGTLNLYNALKAEGFELPKNCGDVQLEMPVDGVFVMVYRVMLDQEDLMKLGRALARMGEKV